MSRGEGERARSLSRGPPPSTLRLDTSEYVMMSSSLGESPSNLCDRRTSTVTTCHRGFSPFAGFPPPVGSRVSLYRRMLGNHVSPCVSSYRVCVPPVVTTC
eukprot:5271483-Prymnesium_polylepis.2